MPIEEACLSENEDKLNAASAIKMDPQLNIGGSKFEACSDVDNIAGKPLILIADDNEDMQGYMFSLLEPFYNIIQATDGKAALAAAKKYKPFVILSDVMMLIMDGYELTKEIKADASLKHIPVILITAKTSDQSETWSVDIGADDCLTKPFSPAELLARTASALRRSKNRISQNETPYFPIDVLIVEDNELNQTVTYNLMKSFGCKQIDIANSGELALNAIEQKNYQLILMDCHIPGMDGLTAARKIRQLEEQNKLEKKIIIALTANGLVGMEERCLEAGIDAYVPKPVKFEYLAKILQEYL